MFYEKCAAGVYPLERQSATRDRYSEQYTRTPGAYHRAQQHAASSTAPTAAAHHSSTAAATPQRETYTYDTFSEKDLREFTTFQEAVFKTGQHILQVFGGNCTRSHKETQSTGGATTTTARWVP